MTNNSILLSGIWIRWDFNDPECRPGPGRLEIMTRLEMSFVSGSYFIIDMTCVCVIAAAAVD